MLRKKIIVKKSINGKGLFAMDNIKKEEIIIEIKGKLITCNEEDNLDKTTRDNTFRFDKKYYLSPKNELGDYLNHSCKPNSKVIKKKSKLYLVAFEKIRKNTEIFMDYSTITAADDNWEMNCNCGEDNCRKVIKGLKTLPKETASIYKVNSIIPSYILNISE